MVSGEINGCAPLFLACRNGSAEVVEYLVTRCGAPIEQKGQFEVRRTLTIIMVTCDHCAGGGGGGEAQCDPPLVRGGVREAGRGQGPAQVIIITSDVSAV